MLRSARPMGQAPRADRGLQARESNGSLLWSNGPACWLPAGGANADSGVAWSRHGDCLHSGREHFAPMLGVTSMMANGIAGQLLAPRALEHLGVSFEHRP